MFLLSTHVSPYAIGTRVDTLLGTRTNVTQCARTKRVLMMYVHALSVPIDVDTSRILYDMRTARVVTQRARTERAVRALMAFELTWGNSGHFLTAPMALCAEVQHILFVRLKKLAKSIQPTIHACIINPPDPTRKDF